MKKMVLLILVAVLTSFLDIQGGSYVLSFPKEIKAEIRKNNGAIDTAVWIAIREQVYFIIPNKPLHEIKALLHKESATLNKEVINKTLTAIKCARKYNIAHNNILTIIDFSLPSGKKRLWVFDLTKNQLLFHTYVSHGIKSGTDVSKYFSNKRNSKASSIGIYNTEKAYYGRYGPALKLYGLDKGFNDNAYNRFIVMHGSWYVEERFIKKYGRAGRSWGCPTLSLKLVKPIIDTIKDNSFLVAYYPGNNWIQKSKFLNCDRLTKQDIAHIKIKEQSTMAEKNLREKILFADLNNNNKREENEPIVVISADNYQRIFKTKVPLKRMLRRQINNSEYIALSHKDFKTLDTNNNKILDSNDKEGLNEVYFVIPVVKKLRGYYATEMKKVTLGKIKEVKLTSDSSEENPKAGRYTIYFEGKPSIELRSTGRFIRWLGL